MGASFKNTTQIIKAYKVGAHTVTVLVDLMEQMMEKNWLKRRLKYLIRADES